MGRWLNRIHADHKNTGMPVWRTDRTDGTNNNEVLSVSSVYQKHDPHFLDATSTQHTDDQHAFEERAAILEYDEAMLRAEAERLAAEQISNVLPFRRDV